MPAQYTPALPATDINISCTFSPGTAEMPAMHLWLDGVEIAIPERVAAVLRADELWPIYYPDQQARLALLRLFIDGYLGAACRVGEPPFGKLKDE